MEEKAERKELLTFWDHINELIKRIKIWIYTLAIASLFFMVFPADISFLQNPFAFYRPFIAVILEAIRIWLLPPTLKLIAGSFTAPIEIYVVASLFFGFLVSVPVLAYQIYRFVDPALSSTEKEAVFPFVTGFSLLFLFGTLFGFFILLPFVIVATLPFLNIVGAEPIIYVDDFYNLVFFTVILSGFAFTIPVFFVLLVKFHIMSTSVLTKNRKYLWAMTFILTAIITPDGGPLADLALFVPIMLLLEAAVIVSKRYERSRSLEELRPEPIMSKCSYCDGSVDLGGVFCGRCGRSRL